MDNERLNRILTKKLRGKYNLPHWPLRLDVENAVNEALQQTDELDNLLIQLRNRAVRFSYRKRTLARQAPTACRPYRCHRDFGYLCVVL